MNNKRVTSGQCRPGGWAWFCTIVFLLVSAGWIGMTWDELTHPTNPPPPFWASVMMIVLAATAAVPTIGFLLWTALSRCSWDEVGLRWRSISREARIPWADITDYYLVPSAQQRKTGGGPLLVVECGRRKLRLVPQFWATLDSLKEAVSTNAVSTMARSWEILGCRATNSRDLVFDYRAWSADSIALLIAAMIAVGLSAYVVGDAILKFPSTQALMGTKWALGGIAASAIVPLFFGMLLSFNTRLYLDMRRRLRQRVVVSPAGIQFKDGNVDIRARWADVSQHGPSTLGHTVKLPCLYVVETAHGRIEFTTLIKDYTLLRRIIAHWAPDATDTRMWKEDVLDAGPSVPRSGSADAHVYHYRTRTIRACLWFCGFCLLIIPLSPILTGHAKPGIEAALLVGSGSIFGWLFNRYRNAAVVVDSETITQYTAFGARRIPWVNVEACRKSEGVVTVFGRGTTIRLFDSISNCRELVSEIQRLAVNARFENLSRE